MFGAPSIWKSGKQALLVHCLLTQLDGVLVSGELSSPDAVAGMLLRLRHLDG